MWLRPGGQYDQNLRDLARTVDADREHQDPHLPSPRRSGCVGTLAILAIIAAVVAGLAWVAGAILQAVFGG